MAKRKYEDFLTSYKYRCCCGCIHIQTITQILCILFLLNYAYEAKKLINSDDRDYSEVLFLNGGIIASIGPLIGIKTKKAKYFFAYFITAIIRFLYGAVVLFSLWAGYPNTPFLKKFYDKYSSSKEVENLFNALTFKVKLILFFMVFFAFSLEAWVCRIIYRCQNYIEVLSFQEDEYRKKANKQRKIKGNNSNKLDDSKSLIKSIKKNTVNGFFEWLFSNKKTSPSDKQQKSKTLDVSNVEHDIQMLRLKSTESKSIEQLKVVTNESKPVECDIKVKLKNMESKETVYFTLNSKSAETIFEKVASYKKPNASKSKIAESIQDVKTEKNEKFKPLENNFGILLKNHIEKTETVILSVKPKSTKVFEKANVKPLPQKLSKTTVISKSYSHRAYKQKKVFANIGIQTDETSFDQRIVKNQFNYFPYNSESHIQKPFIPCSEYINEQISPITASSGFVSRSDPDFSPNPETVVTFLFKNDETCAVEIYKNGRKQMLKNLFENEWTPLYFSMATQKPEIGEKAQIHFHQFPENVLFDIFKIIGKPLNEIEINREWKFKIIEENGIKYFKIQTQNGLQLFPENIIVATFLKSMKILAENYLNFEIHEIYIFSNFEITESQKSVIKNAASKVHLKILSFSCNE